MPNIARTLLVVAATALLAGLPMTGARAQLGGAGLDHHAAGPKPPEDDAAKPLAPPPAIPGAVSNPDRVAPAPKGTADLDPNAALFDAIDRGDLTAAREALGRGADLNARNVLGQRPIDMSIDLSRNDITFLLLSLRAQNGDQAPAAAPDDASLAANDAEGGGAGGGEAMEGATVVKPDRSGGAPKPSDGFLGFGR